jgi:hypothetical protein
MVIPVSSIYLATDERSQDGLRYLRENQALLFDDLVEQEDRRAFGWPLLFTDVTALVEQHSAHILSAFAHDSNCIYSYRARRGLFLWACHKLSCRRHPQPTGWLRMRPKDCFIRWRGPS